MKCHKFGSSAEPAVAWNRFEWKRELTFSVFEETVSIPPPTGGRYQNWNAFERRPGEAMVEKQMWHLVLLLLCPHVSLSVYVRAKKPTAEIRYEWLLWIEHERRQWKWGCTRLQPRNICTVCLSFTCFIFYPPVFLCLWVTVQTPLAFTFFLPLFLSAFFLMLHPLFTFSRFLLSFSFRVLMVPRWSHWLS